MALTRRRDFFDKIFENYNLRLLFTFLVIAAVSGVLILVSLIVGLFEH
jgi:hypothetical protein